MKKKLDHYLEEEKLLITLDFYILTWCKQNGVKHPTLQAIAKDVLSSHCSQLHFTTLEALMCGKSWLWSIQNIGNFRNSLLIF